MKAIARFFQQIAAALENFSSSLAIGLWTRIKAWHEPMDLEVGGLSYCRICKGSRVGPCADYVNAQKELELLRAALNSTD